MAATGNKRTRAGHCGHLRAYRTETDGKGGRREEGLGGKIDSRCITSITDITGKKGKSVQSTSNVECGVFAEKSGLRGRSTGGLKNLSQVGGC